MKLDAQTRIHIHAHTYNNNDYIYYRSICKLKVTAIVIKYK